MKRTQMQQYDVPGAATPQARPLTIATAGNVPLRVLVRNIGPFAVFCAAASEDAIGAGLPSSSTFQIPPGEEDVFVISPKEGLYAIGPVPGGRVAVSASEALPLV